MAQRKVEPATIKGTLGGIEKDGRTIVLTVKTDDGGEQEFRLTGRTPFVVSAEGDDGFLAANQFVTTTAVLTNQRLFGKEFTVLLGKGRKPRSVLAKAPEKVGQSKNSYVVAGVIASRQQDAEYKDYETITLKIGKGTPVFLDKGFGVTVQADDPSLAQPGATVELEGRPLSGGRFNPTKVTVTLKEPLKSQDYFAAEDKAK